MSGWVGGWMLREVWVVGEGNTAALQQLIFPAVRTDSSTTAPAVQLFAFLCDCLFFTHHFYYPAQPVGGFTLGGLLDKVMSWSQVSSRLSPALVFMLIAHSLECGGRFFCIIYPV